MAKIAKTDGSIYFLRDVDYLTGEVGKYVKVGLVRKDKSTEQRIKEHQTGNPRGIKDVHTMTGVPFVEKLETQLHYRFIEKWIAGEWMDLNDEELKEVIKEGERLREEQEIFRNELMNADNLAKDTSNGSSIPFSDELLDLKDKYITLHERSERISGELKLIRSQLLSFLGDAGSIPGVISVSLTAAGSSFDVKRFETEHPDLFSQYKVFKQGTVSGSFSVIGKQMFKKIAPEMDEQIKCLPKENFTGNNLEKVIPLTDEIKKRHVKHLKLLKDQKMLEWEMDLIECQLKMAIGDHDEIADVCKWKRVKREDKEEFDEAGFKSDLPDVYDQYLVQKPGVFKVTISNTRPYPF
jgi:hypothetical protein